MPPLPHSALLAGIAAATLLAFGAGCTTSTDNQTAGSATAAATSAPAVAGGGQIATPGGVTLPTSSPGATPAAVVASPTAASAGSSVGGGAAGSSNAAARVYAQNSAWVVNITSLAVAQTASGPTQAAEGIGSGFMFDADGRIVTNNHVVQDASQLSVTLKDGTSLPARLVGRDPDNDLAVVQIDPNATDDNGRPVRDRIKPITLGDSDRITIGEDAIAVGSPLGLSQTVTSGIVSALRAPGEDTPAGQLDLLGGAVQTDAAINPGNSGGPLFNARGEVIGVNTEILSRTGTNIGIGFAIPANVVKRVVPVLIAQGRYPHPLIGVTTLPLSALGQAARQQLGIQPNQTGLLVQEASAGAAQAGIQAGNRAVNLGGTQVRTGGDVIVAVDGQPVTNGGDLRAYIENSKRPGDSVSLTLVRNGQRQDVTVNLTERQESPSPTPGSNRAPRTP